MKTTSVLGIKWITKHSIIDVSVIVEDQNTINKYYISLIISINLNSLSLNGESPTNPQQAKIDRSIIGLDKILDIIPRFFKVNIEKACIYKGFRR